MAISLDQRYIPFIKKWDQYDNSLAPRLVLEMKAIDLADEHEGVAKLCITTPFMIKFSITQLSGFADNNKIIFRWSAWENLAKGRFVLLHETVNGALERVEVGMLQGLIDSMYSEEEQQSSVQESEVRSSAAGRREVRAGHLTANYQTRLTPGETYHLIWPGGEIKVWEWGSLEELWNTHLQPRADGEARRPFLWLPAVAGIIFTAYEAETPFPERGIYIEQEGPHVSYDTANEMEIDWRLKQNVYDEGEVRGSAKLEPVAKISIGAPVLNHEIIQAGPFFTVTRVTYAASSGNKPIIFRKWPFFRRGCSLYKLQGKEWTLIPDDADIVICYPVDEDEDGVDNGISVKVGDDNNDFISLQPGESWVNKTTYYPLKDFRSGDKFKFIFNGTTLDWWDWGTKADHLDTTVILPFWNCGDVSIPGDNNGRPQVVVAASPEVDFTWDE